MAAAAALTERRTLVVDDGEVRVRAAVSPLATTLASLLEVVGGQSRGAPEAWRRLILERARLVDVRALSLFDALGGELPDFLLPAPRAGVATISEELERVRATSDAAIERDLRFLTAGAPMPAAALPFRDTPREALARHCAALADYWDRVFATSWPRLREIVDRNVAELGLRLVTGGPQAALGSLHPRVSVDAHAIAWSSDEALSDSLRGRTVVVAPIICGAAGLLTNDMLADTVILAPAARGVAEAWGEAPDRRHDLERALGDTRARVLRALAIPSTTTGLADALRLSPATVSHHLCALRRAGLATRARRGRRVYYRLTERGTQLVDLF